jgi:uncharacterized protein (TIGR02996 family)
MVDEATLLQAILDEPDDDAPRLIYADWLEEHGDPRGEFILVQCALARCPLTDRRRPGLLARERTLLARYKDEWAGPLGDLVREGEFRRGFLDAVSLSADVFLAQAETLFAVAPVREVHLREAGWLMKELAACPYLERLRVLSLAENDLAPAELEVFAGSPHLGGLKALKLWQNNLGAAGAGSLAASASLAALEELDLWKNDLGDAGARALSCSPHLGRLRRLDLGCNDIGPGGVRALLDSPFLKRLTWLDLRGNWVPEAETRLLQARFGFEGCRY